jgi:hypothetical protein
MDIFLLLPTVINFHLLSFAITCIINGSQLLYCFFHVDIALVIDMETSDPSPLHPSIHSSFSSSVRTSSPARYSSPSRTSSPLPFSTHTSSSFFVTVPTPVPTRSSFPLPAPASVSVHGVTAHSHTHTLNDTRLPEVHVRQGIGALGFGAPYLTAPWGQKILSTVYQSYVG